MNADFEVEGRKRKDEKRGQEYYHQLQKKGGNTSKGEETHLLPRRIRERPRKKGKMAILFAEKEERMGRGKKNAITANRRRGGGVVL